MKKIWSLIICAVILISLTACSNPANVKHVRREVGESNSHSKEEINKAMDIVISNFEKHFDGCTLYDLCYNEELSVEAEKEWAESYEAEQAIVLYCQFTTGEKTVSLEPYSIYSGWQWILTKSGEEDWTIQTGGYA